MNLQAAEIRRLAYVKELVEQNGELFPQEIEDDPWVAYHGTSGVNETSIETKGFRWDADLVSRNDVEKVVEVFERMNWIGQHQGGFPVLSTFTLDGDFGASTMKPIYFAEIGIRAITFATHEFAGGETVRALRHSLADLNAYLTHEKTRDDHRRGRNRLAESRSATIDLSWLRSQSESLQPLMDRCQTLRDAHRHGVVYAVRFERTDLDGMELHQCMGIKAHGVVPAARIVAKTLVPESATVPMATPEQTLDRFLRHLGNPQGLLGSLKAKDHRG